MTPSTSSAPAPDSTLGEHSGARLGLPASGPGALAPLGRRVVALAVDWAVCLLICVGLLRMPLGATGTQGLLPNVVLLVENVLLVGTAGATIGHRLLGMQVRRLDGGPVGIAGAALRSLLLLLVVPAVMWDADGRGFHDKIPGTVLVRTR